MNKWIRLQDTFFSFLLCYLFWTLPILSFATSSVAGSGATEQAVVRPLLKNRLLLPIGEGPPQYWQHASRSEVADSKFLYKIEDGKGAIGLVAGYDRQAAWSSPLAACTPGRTYEFSADFLRTDLRNAKAYPEISLWGKWYKLNTHRVAGKFQRLKVLATCPAKVGNAENRLVFRNNYPGNTFWMRSPQLVERRESGLSTAVSAPKSRFFPIGVYGGKAANLAAIKGLGFNTAVLRLTRENVEKCRELEMHCTLAVPHKPGRLRELLAKLQPMLQQGRFDYYVNDEPEIHSFAEDTAEEIQGIIKQRFPEAVTNMAIVRPQGIPFYRKAADYFMLDQYPVPNMPMVWLSDSMDEAAGYVGKNRLQSVIQAFGGGKHASAGWPRLPNYEEMNCLAFLSIVHGSRGIYFFTYPIIAASEQGEQDLSLLVRRLNSMKSWLVAENRSDQVSLQMTSTYRFDPRGNPAVHCTSKERYKTRMLICVNTIGTYTEAKIDIETHRSRRWEEYFTGEPHVVADGNILARFDPYEVKVLLESK